MTARPGRIDQAIEFPFPDDIGRAKFGPLFEIQRWLKSLRTENELAWTTISKMRGTMLRIYKVGILHELVTRNPVLPVETRAVTSYKAILVTPQQTLAILQNLQSPLHRILVLTCAATALRSSELLALRWADIDSERSKISVSKRWSYGKDGPTQSRKSDGHDPLHPALACHLNEWRAMTPYAKETDFVFPSLKSEGRVPVSPAVFVATTFGRQQSRPAFRFQMATDLVFTTCAIASVTGW